MHMQGKPWLIVGLLLGTAAYAIAEDITLTTYYPSPRGVYQDLRALNGMVIGDLAVPPGAALHVIQTDNDPALLVQQEGNAAAFRVDDEAGDTSPFVIAGTGAVGIGVTPPVAQLHVVQPDATIGLRVQQFGDERALLVQQEGNAPALVVTDQAGDTTPFVIDQNGNVGIGTGTPTKPLVVNGGVAFEGNHLYLRNPAAPVNSQTWGMVVANDGRLMIGPSSTDVPPLLGGPSQLQSRPVVINDGAPDSSLVVNATGRVMVGSGTEASPGLTFTADSDTGIYLRTANELAISAGGGDTLVVGDEVVGVRGRMHLTTTQGGFRPPRMTTGERNLIPAANRLDGMIIYNSELDRMEIYQVNGAGVGTWRPLGGGSTQIVTVTGATAADATAPRPTATATCPAGRVATGGGCRVAPTNCVYTISESYPTSSNGWHCRATYDGSSGGAVTGTCNVTAYVVCMQ